MCRELPNIPMKYFYNIQPEMAIETKLTSLWNAGNVIMDRAENVLQRALTSNVSLDKDADLMITFVSVVSEP